MGHLYSQGGYCMKCGIHVYQADIAPSCEQIRLNTSLANARNIVRKLPVAPKTTKEE